MNDDHSTSNVKLKQGLRIVSARGQPVAGEYADEEPFFQDIAEEEIAALTQSYDEYIARKNNK